MSSVTSSTSTIVSPYATVKEQIRPGKFEANEKEYGAVGAAVIGVGDAVADGASTTVSLSEKALNAVEDAGRYVGAAEPLSIAIGGCPPVQLTASRPLCLTGRERRSLYRPAAAAGA